ncbi:hypothetical protein F4820DRAFT_358390 [Hypoxylon rubiginosum]|uniref:Uncharacterized protein n=1 Tax=Hypoxylon rubiginosum TaxID=110542 RepID=A0ACB9YXE9_9PEZI|nr:hypothetical protein F4820DRAFT_358390 [Hypoxylon rubiginosum]
MSSTSSSRRTSRNYDTGFPDAFSEYTTTLRHPDANISPGACISAEDVDPSRTLQRTRRSILAKHRRMISHGTITQEPNQQQANGSALGLQSGDSAVDMGDAKPADTNVSIGRSSEDGAESIDNLDLDLDLFVDGDYSPSSPSAPTADDLANDGPQKFRLFRKWRG